VSQRTAIKFLRSTWGQQHSTGVAFLSTKDWDTEAWEDLPQQGKVILPTLDDLYFCPNFFSEPRRLRKVAQPGRWLYADLDEVNPGKLPDFLEPTVAWETSPGRFQALWLLARPLRPAQLEAINQKLTYYTMADRGGWSSTKVLRVPGSYNNKRERRHLVRLLWSDGPEYAASSIYDLVREVETPRDISEQLPDLKLPKADAARLFKRHRPKLTIEARRLLREPVAQGGRSEAMWKLQRLLLEAGIAPAQAFVMVKAAPCNKYRGQRREDKQLWTEIQRAVSQGTSSSTRSTGGADKSRSSTASSSATRRSQDSRSSRSKRSATSLDEIFDDGTHRKIEVVHYNDFLNQQIQHKAWMVNGIWSEGAHGLIAGEPKTYKSVISMDLAVSVASGTPFLGHFPIPKTGPALLIQEENDPGDVQDRLLRIAHSKHLGETVDISGGRIKYKDHRELPIHLVNGQGIDLANPKDLHQIDEMIGDLKPALVVLDPWYMLTPGIDENSQAAVSPIMAKLMRMKQRHNTGLLIVHHFNKANPDSPRKKQDRVSGSGVFARWYESELLLERENEEENEVKITPLHRSHGAQGVIHAKFDLGERDNSLYEVDVEVSRKAEHEFRTTEDTLKRTLEAMGGRVTLSQLESELGASRNTVKKRVEEAGLVLAQGRQNGKRVSIVKLPAED